MISQTSEYALRAIVCLASRPNDPWTTHELAERTRVPAGYLSKVMQALGRARLVLAQRGPHGGFRLSRAAESVSVLDVINAVDPIQRIRECPLGLRSHGANLCPLHRRLDDALSLAERAFAVSTIRELIDTPSASTPLCEAPDSAGAGSRHALPIRAPRKG